MIGKCNRRNRANTRTRFTAAMEPLEGRRLLAGDVALVKDIVAGGGGSNPSDLTVANDLLFFRANGTAGDAELWRSDGTAAGTFRVKDINPGAATSNPRKLTAANGKLYFIADDATGAALWATDGTEAGTVRVTASGVVIRNLTADGSGLYFTVGTTGVNPDFGDQLWHSDGTAVGTALVKDLTPTAAASKIGALAMVNGTLFFGGADDTTGRELWKSDGTANGTVLVKDIVPGATQSDVHSMIEFNGAAYFGATGGLWKSDGTTAGTVLVSSASVTPTTATYSRRAIAGDSLLFIGSDGSGPNLWRSDGTTAGTALLKDLSGPSGGYLPVGFVTVGDTVFLPGQGALFMSDGTAAGTVPVSTTMPAAASNVPNTFVQLDGAFYFGASNALHESDGTPAGTSVVDTLSATPTSLAVYKGGIYFAGNDGTHGSELMALPANVAPVVSGTTVETDSDTEILIDLRPLASDAETPAADLEYDFTEPDSDAGTLATTGTNGVLRFTPAAGFTGDASFSFSVSDDGAPAGSNNNVRTSGTATVNITVHAPNAAPLSAAASVQTGEDESVEIDLRGSVSDAETDAARLAIVVTGAPDAGVGTLAATDTPGVFRFTPAANYDGPVSFTYAVTDDGGLTSAPATVTIDVAAANDAPTAAGVTADVSEDGSTAVVLSGSDAEAAAGDLTIRVTSLPTSGTLLHDGQAVTLGSEFAGGTASLTYIAGAAAVGPRADAFTYVAIESGAASPLTSNEATVSLNVVAAVEEGKAAIDTAGVLRIGGTAGNDAIAVRRTGSTVRVVLNGATVLSGVATASISDVRVFARGGNDQVNLASLATTTFVNAGPGNDTVKGGSGDDVLIGGLGANTLTGGSGDDFLIGGASSDRLAGSAGADVLAAGDVAGNASLAALRVIAAQWAGAHVASPAAGMFGGDTIATDGSVDTLTGAAGADWFIVDSGDKADLKKKAADPLGDLVTVVE